MLPQSGHGRRFGFLVCCLDFDAMKRTTNIINSSEKQRVARSSIRPIGIPITDSPQQIDGWIDSCSQLVASTVAPISVDIHQGQLTRELLINGAN